MKRIIFLTVAALLIISLFAACTPAPAATTGSASPQPTATAVETPAPSASTPAASTPPLPVTRPAETLDITFVVPLISPYWDDCANGMRKAVEEIGNINLNYVGASDTAGLVEAFIRNLQTAVTSNPDGLLTMCAIEDAEKPSINEAVDNGIPVVLVDTDGPNTERAAYIGTDNEEAGRSAGEEMARLTGENATIAIVSNNITAAELTKRIDGFKAAIAAYPGMEVVDTEQATTTLEMTQKVESLLLAYPDVNAIFCTDGLCVGVAQAIREKNLIGTIKVVGFDSNDEILADVKEGSLSATVSQVPYLMGYLGIYRMVSILEGNPVPADQVIVHTAADVINIDNVDNYITN